MQAGGTPGRALPPRPRAFRRGRGACHCRRARAAACGDLPLASRPASLMHRESCPLPPEVPLSPHTGPIREQPGSRSAPPSSSCSPSCSWRSPDFCPAASVWRLPSVQVSRQWPACAQHVPGLRLTRPLPPAHRPVPARSHLGVDGATLSSRPAQDPESWLAFSTKAGRRAMFSPCFFPAHLLGPTLPHRRLGRRASGLLSELSAACARSPGTGCTDAVVLFPWCPGCSLE